MILDQLNGIINIVSEKRKLNKCKNDAVKL